MAQIRKIKGVRDHVSVAGMLHMGTIRDPGPRESNGILEAVFDNYKIRMMSEIDICRA